MAGTVTVACRVPNGLLLRVFGMIDDHEPVIGGGSREIKRAVQMGESVLIKGPATPVGQAPQAQIAAGYALTPNVDADFFAKWMEDNKTHPAVVNRLIFAHERLDVVTKTAKDHENVVSGLEGIDPDGDPRVSKNIRKADNKL